MTKITTLIIPKRTTFAKVNAPHELHLEAICVFAAIGFFLDQDTYWKDQVALTPASTHTIADSGLLTNSKPWFQWHYSPRNISFEQTLEEFIDLFETIVKEQSQGKKVILPISGGLDSRTQATALKHLGSKVTSYSYEFENGYPETHIAIQIAKACGFEFKSFTIPKGYLWDKLDTLVDLNRCYSDFTNPRQMAIYEEFPKLKGEVFSLGHWGDVLFDSMNVPQLSKEDEVEVMVKKLVKKGGMEMASTLWNVWGLEGSFKEYFRERIGVLLDGIAIENSNAKLRAFKSLYWAPRWTSVNLSVFEAHYPISLPYYDDRMCQFICTVPEAYLKNRQLQLAYIKLRAPELARITWQNHQPFNINNYHLNKFPFNTKYKVVHKLKRELMALWGKPYIQRNWELQFLGKENENQLKAILDHKRLLDWIPKSVVNIALHDFFDKPEPKMAHQLNMLLVLAKFAMTS